MVEKRDDLYECKQTNKQTPRFLSKEKEGKKIHIDYCRKEFLFLFVITCDEEEEEEEDITMKSKKLSHAIA